ncbi:MAG: GIY-YIG nuclease family protein [Patescibacteria group bacterium]|nr:GIY-YIG nuclease family protein [Patescibacteria group bacterium]
MNIRRSDFAKYYVYILLSLKDNRFYAGFTTDLKDRLSTTMGFSPWLLT